MIQAIASVVRFIISLDRTQKTFVAKSPQAQMCQEVGFGWAQLFTASLRHLLMANASNPQKKTENASIINPLRQQMLCGLS